MPILDQPGHVPLLIGGDCSIVVGTTQALMKSAGLDQVHVLYIDGDCDDGTPDSTKSQSAAYLALWLAMHGQPFGRVLGFHLLKSRSSARRRIVNVEPRSMLHG